MMRSMDELLETGYARVKKLVTLYLRGRLSAEQVWEQMNQLDRAGDITDDDWAYASSIVP